MCVCVWIESPIEDCRRTHTIPNRQNSTDFFLGFSLLLLCITDLNFDRCKRDGELAGDAATKTMYGNVMAVETGLGMGRENGSRSMDGIKNGTELDSGGCVCAMKTRWKKSKRTVRTTDRCDRLAPNNKYLMISSGFA